MSSFSFFFFSSRRRHTRSFGDWSSDVCSSDLNVRLYAERLRHNMTVEELILFPAALRHFGAEDWRAIEEAPGRAPSDPLFPAPAEARFVQLHRVIAAEAQCGCEDE